MEKNTAGKTVREGLKKIEEGVVTGYKGIEECVVTSYKKIENGVVEGFTKVNDRMIEKLFAEEGESVEDAKKRLGGEASNRKQ